MGMFQRRPLAAALSLFLAVSLGIALLASSDRFVTASPQIAAGLFWGFVLLLASLATAFAVAAVIAKKSRLRRVLAALAVCAALLGAVRSGTHFILRYAEAQRLVGERVSVTLTVQETEVSIPGYVRYRARVDEMLTANGEKVGLHGFDATVLFEGIVEYGAGDLLAVEAVGIPLTELYESASVPIANGCLIGLAVLPLDLVQGTDPMPETSPWDGDAFAVRLLMTADEREVSLLGQIRSACSSLRARLSFLLREELGGAVGALSAAVLLGDRAYLDGSVVRDFERAGISHLLAISGLHMVVLIGGITLFLKKLRLPRRWVAVGTLISIVFFLFLTEFPLSSCRAGAMLAFASVVSAVARRPDPITSLFLAVSLLVCIDPPAVMSTGLWMSFSSVLGLLVLSGRWSAYLRVRMDRPVPKGLRGGIRRIAMRTVFFVLSGVGVSLIASFSILPVLTATGGEFALLAPITNLLTVSLMTPFLILSVVLLLLCRLSFFGPLTGLLLRGLGGWILSAAEAVSSVQGATVSLARPFAGIAVAVFALLMLFFLVAPPSLFDGRRRPEVRGGIRRRERRFRLAWMLLPPLVATVLYTVGYFAHFARLSSLTGLPATVTDASTGEMLVLADGGTGVLVDLSDGRFRGYSNARRAAEERGVTEWSMVVLTHYHSRQGAALSRFCSEELVRTVYLPTPVTEEEHAILETVLNRISAVGVEYRFYERGAELQGEFDIFVSLPAYLERSAQPIYYLSVERDGTALTYLTQSVVESSLSDAAWERASASTYLVYGSDGPKPRAVFRIPTDGVRTVLTYGEELFTYLSPISKRALEDGDAVWVHDAETADLYAP